MKIDAEAVEIIIDTVTMIVNDKISKLPYDRTLTGVVKAVLPNNKYTVLVNGSTYDISANAGTTYTVAQTVKVFIPCGDWSKIELK